VCAIVCLGSYSCYLLALYISGKTPLQRSHQIDLQSSGEATADIGILFYLAQTSFYCTNYMLLKLKEEIRNVETIPHR
jgi:hypothetical protein